MLEIHYFDDAGKPVVIPIPEDTVYVTVAATDGWPPVEVCVNPRGVVVECDGQDVHSADFDQVLSDAGIGQHVCEDCGTALDESVTGDPLLCENCEAIAREEDEDEEDVECEGCGTLCYPEDVDASGYCLDCQDRSDECILGTQGICKGDVWECETCHETFCETHWHETSKGKNVECSSCERERLEEDQA